ncbi:uncharacterized protein LOC125593295 [Brassica napus]|uniref:uncharacterized protein LOC125593295 n=1 Tax=Brassica napus TaxID=3708 RepID=UPI002079E741|nr:uncharacterized protein LOC125593295 [Brassica napus]
MDRAIYSLETRFEQFQKYEQTFGCHCRKKLFQAKVDKILSTINHVTRKAK